jgi:cell division initiation protein
MPLSPIEVQKQKFAVKMRGYDQVEVENFLGLLAEELSQRVAEIDRLARDNQALAERVAMAEGRERQLQDALLRGKVVSDEMISTSHREAQLLIKEAEITADKLITQAMERAQEIESRIAELRTRRKELQIKLRGTLELFAQILEADFEEERATASVHTIGRKKA